MLISEQYINNFLLAFSKDFSVSLISDNDWYYSFELGSMTCLNVLFKFSTYSDTLLFSTNNELSNSSFLYDLIFVKEFLYELIVKLFIEETLLLLI